MKYITKRSSADIRGSGGNSEDESEGRESEMVNVEYKWLPILLLLLLAFKE